MPADAPATLAGFDSIRLGAVGDLQVPDPMTVVAERQILTPDLGGKAKTTEVGTGICRRILG